MSNLITREFWAATADRAIKTVAQTGLAVAPAVFIADEAGIVNFNGIPWFGILGTAVLAGGLSVLTSIVGDVATKNGPSFTRSEGIGVENAEAEEALRLLRAGEDPVRVFDTRVSLEPEDLGPEPGPEDHDADEAEVVDLADTGDTHAEDPVPAAEDADEAEAVDATDDPDPTPPAPGWSPKH